jgi:anti-sigma B factor antagonist
MAGGVSISGSGGLGVHTEFDPPRITLALRGELDLAGAPMLERAIAALPWPRLAELVFDLAGLTFIDSTGLGVLIQASQRAAAAGLRFSVVRVPAQPRKLFTIAGVIDSLNVQP